MLRYALMAAILVTAVVLSGCRREEDSPMNGVLTNVNESVAIHRGWQEATFAAGCFWGVEAAFRNTEGVKATEVGYTGGHTVNPTYEQVCSGGTGHAEAVRVWFDPAVTSYDRLLDVFWRCHDPTQFNRQGPDVGKQYRSAIFYHNEAQRAAAEQSLRRLRQSGRFARPVVTEITAAGPFYRAEEYHQQYHEKHGGYCPA